MPKIKLDWRKPEDYEFTQDLELDEWAWEFLRRCPEYRQEWANLAKRYPVGKRFGGIDIIFNDCGAWGMRFYLDPEIKNSNSFGFTPPGGGMFNPYSFDRKSKGLVLMTGTTKVYCEFDVRLPINPQIKNIRKILENCQKKCPTKTRKSFKPNYPHAEWPKYLRLLDALIEEALDPEIEAVLYPESGQRFFDKKSQAMRLACQDYRYIPFLTKNRFK